MYRQMVNKGISENGSSSVEFALILPVLILLLFGIIEFGFVFNNYLAITHAAREGARLAAVGHYSEAVVRERAYPATPSAIVVSYPNGDKHGEPVQVAVRADSSIFIPLFGSRTIPLESQAEMRIEY
jgi:hypothetical protein